MPEIILYPTETIYALGVNAFDEAVWRALCELKGRSDTQPASWLVRSLTDIETYGILSKTAEQIANTFLPGPLTLVVPVKKEFEQYVAATDKTVSFRVSPDQVAAQVIDEYMNKHDVPLTCTSANRHGLPPLQTSREILEQFGSTAGMVTQVVDDGPRSGVASTVVRVVNDEVTILREGAIPSEEIVRNIDKKA